MLRKNAGKMHSGKRVEYLAASLSSARVAFLPAWPFKSLASLGWKMCVGGLLSGGIIELPTCSGCFSNLGTALSEFVDEIRIHESLQMQSNQPARPWRRILSSMNHHSPFLKLETTSQKCLYFILQSHCAKNLSFLLVSQVRTPAAPGGTVPTVVQHWFSNFSL
jgi:hypothetical protein